MAKTPRKNICNPDEIAIVHCMNRVARKDFLLGPDPETGVDYGYRKLWFEFELRRVAGCFGIDLLTYSILDNHFHLILRSRPDIVKKWCDHEVARRWFLLCPKRKNADGTACEPNEAEIRSITSDQAKVDEHRSRLSNISWWMRLVTQRIAQRANRETGEKGCFWAGRFESVRLLDEASILACSAYVDLNPIRAAKAQMLEDCLFSAIKRRLDAAEDRQPQSQATQPEASAQAPTATPPQTTTATQPETATLSQLKTDAFLAPLEIDERNDPLGPQPSEGDSRCSDKGFLSMSMITYIKLLDWTARQIARGKKGHTPEDAPPVVERLGIGAEAWCQLATGFRSMFGKVAGMPASVDAHRAQCHSAPCNMPAATRELLSSQSA